MLRTLFFITLFLFALYYAFYAYSRRWANPYKLIHIFGKKGSGKSCLMVREMIKHQKRGWYVYTDMQDCNIPGVRIIKAFDLARFRPEYHSLVCLDEIGITFDNRDFKSFPPGLRDFFKFQRKYRVKIYMNSQSASDYEKKIRDVTDSMILQSSIFDCISISRPISITFKPTESTSEADGRIAPHLKIGGLFTWKFYWMPKYHKYFNSFAAPERKLIRYTELGTTESNKKLKAAVEIAPHEAHRLENNNTDGDNENA